MAAVAISDMKSRDYNGNAFARGTRLVRLSLQDLQKAKGAGGAEKFLRFGGKAGTTRQICLAEPTGC